MRPIGNERLNEKKDAFVAVVMAGLVPAIHVLLLDARQERVDVRHKAGHDEGCLGWRKMTVAALFFYLFAGVAVASAFMVIAAKNPVHSVLFLILTFVNAAGLFVLLGAEFLAMILVVVYVGAVAVLFLFVVMMLDVDFVALREGFLQYLPVGALVGVVFLVELLLVVGAWSIGPGVPRAITTPIPAPDVVTNTEALGLVLYTRYLYFFQAAGLVLLIAMIGAIVLTLHHRRGIKRQNISEQVARTPAAAVELRKVQPGQGI